MLLKKVKKLYPKIYAAYEIEAKAQGRRLEDSMEFDYSNSGYGVYWHSTAQGHTFWSSLDDIINKLNVPNISRYSKAAYTTILRRRYEEEFGKDLVSPPSVLYPIF